MGDIVHDAGDVFTTAGPRGVVCSSQSVNCELGSKAGGKRGWAWDARQVLQLTLWHISVWFILLYFYKIPYSSTLVDGARLPISIVKGTVSE